MANAQVRLIPASHDSVETDTIRAQASFRIRLTDYNVSIPLPVRLKVSNEIRVNVAIRAVAS